MPNVPNRTKLRLINALSGLTVQAFIMQDDYTYDPDHDTISEVLGAGTELSVANYSRQTPVAGFNAVQDDTNDLAEAQYTKVLFGGGSGLTAGQNMRHLFLAIDSGNDAVDEVLAHFDIGTGSGVATNGLDIEFRFNGVDGTGAAIRVID